MKTFQAIGLILLSALFLASHAGCGWGGWNSVYYRYDEADTYLAGGGSLTFLDEISLIEVNWVTGSVEIREAEDDVISFSESGADAQAYPMYWRNTGTSLQIRFVKNNTLLKQIRKTLTLFVPRGVSVSKLKSETVSADCVMSGVAPEEAEFHSVSGNVCVTDGAGMRLEAETVSGNVSVNESAFDRISVETVSGATAVTPGENGRYQTLTVSSVSGALNARFDDAVQSIRFDTTSGNALLTMTGLVGFTAHLDTVSGHISSQASKDWVYGDGSVLIEMDSVSGSLQIETL